MRFPVHVDEKTKRYSTQILHFFGILTTEDVNLALEIEGLAYTFNFPHERLHRAKRRHHDTQISVMVHARGCVETITDSGYIVDGMTAYTKMWFCTNMTRSRRSAVENGHLWEGLTPDIDVVSASSRSREKDDQGYRSLCFLSVLDYLDCRGQYMLTILCSAISVNIDST